MRGVHLQDLGQLHLVLTDHDVSRAIVGNEMTGLCRSHGSHMTVT